MSDTKVWSRRSDGRAMFIEEDGRPGALAVGPNMAESVAWVASSYDKAMLWCSDHSIVDKPLGDFRQKWLTARQKWNESQGGYCPGFCAGVDPFGNWTTLPLGAAEYIKLAVTNLCVQINFAMHTGDVLLSDGLSMASCHHQIDPMTAVFIIICKDDNGHWAIREFYAEIDGIAPSAPKHRDYYQWSRAEKRWIELPSQK